MGAQGCLGADGGAAEVQLLESDVPAQYLYGGAVGGATCIRCTSEACTRQGLCQGEGICTRGEGPAPWGATPGCVWLGSCAELGLGLRQTLMR